MNSIRLSWFNIVTAALVASACQSASPDTGGVDPAPSRVGPEDALRGAIDQLRFGFQESGDAFVAGWETHDATVRAGGDLVMVPRHFDGAQTIDGTPLTFATASIRRGDQELAIARATARLDRDHTVIIDRGAASEVIENRDDGVEQTWHFAGEPAGEGDLVVEVAVSGQRTVDSSRTGLHFLSGDRLGAAYSHAMWVDASGTSWTIPVSWDGQRIAMQVPASVLARSAWPAALDPVIGPERAVDSPVAGFTGGAAQDSQVSRGDSATFLVVWTDNRNGNERESEVYAARVTANGVPIDDRGIPVAHTTLLEHEPTVTWTGTEWLMAWTREDATNAGISAATVSTTGVATDLGVIAGTFGRENEPALASDGAGGALLVYQWNDHIRAQRYSAGAFAPFFNVAATPDLEAHPTVVHSAGGNYLVAWENGATPGQDVFARRIVPSGTNPPAFSVSEAPNSLSHLGSAFDGTNYILAWRRGGDIWGARISTAGAVLDTTGAIGGIELSANANVQADPAIGCSTTQCVLAWGDARDNSDPGDVAYDLIAQRFDFNLAPVGGEITVANLVRNQNEPSVTSTANGAFVVTWTDARTGVPSVFATRITSTGGVTRNGTLVNTALKNAQNRGAYAVGTSTQLAVWSDSRSFGDDIMARRYDPAGARLDPDSLVVSNAEWDQASPAVAFDGAQYVSVWRDARNPTSDIFAARMQEDGTLSDPGGVPVVTAAAGQISPDIASDGAGVSLVAWQDRRDAATTGSDIRASILVDGAVSVGDFAICATTDEQVNAAVTFDPNSGLFVVAWSDRRNAGSSDIYAARVDLLGNVLDPCGVPISAEATNWQQIPSLAVSGGQILVVWEDYRNDFFGDIWGGRITVDAGGITRLDGDGVPIAEGASWQVTPTTIGVGNGNWGIAWSDNVDEFTSGSDIHGNTMAADGTLSIEPEYVISNGVYYESAPRFQSGPGGSTVALMYEYDHPSVGVLRVRRRLITY